MKTEAEKINCHRNVWNRAGLWKMFKQKISKLQWRCLLGAESGTLVKSDKNSIEWRLIWFCALSVFWYSWFNCYISLYLLAALSLFEIWAFIPSSNWSVEACDIWMDIAHILGEEEVVWVVDLNGWFAIETNGRQKNECTLIAEDLHRWHGFQ